MSSYYVLYASYKLSLLPLFNNPVIYGMLSPQVPQGQQLEHGRSRDLVEVP